MADTIAVCIPTHERPELLKRALHYLAQQDHMPDEIVVSDSSSGTESANVVRQFSESGSGITVRYVRSERSSLPWQRWLAFTHSTSTVVLFIDDDIRLAPEAVERVLAEYAGSERVLAGVGILISFEDGWICSRRETSLRDRLLGISAARPGTITSGGISISSTGLGSGNVHDVAWLSGGAMSFRRQCLEAVGEFKGLHHLYELRIGSAEDCVLSATAARSTGGRLVLLSDPLAFHPPLAKAVRTADVHEGWRKGLRETIGRAHTMRWLAHKHTSLILEWVRTAGLEIGRAASDIIRHPVKGSAWMRLGGGLYGLCLSVLLWPSLSDDPREELRISWLPGVAL